MFPREDADDSIWPMKPSVREWEQTGARQWRVDVSRPKEMIAALIRIIRDEREASRKLALDCRACLIDARKCQARIDAPDG